MPKNVSLDDLLKAMGAAEQRWQADEDSQADEAAEEEEDTEAAVPLTYEELTHLQEGEEVTVIKWTRHESEYHYEVIAATITRVRQYGWTDLKGNWSGDVAEGLVPSYVISYKREDGDNDFYNLTSLETTKVYLDWLEEDFEEHEC